MTKFIALIHGINVGGHAILPMDELRTLCMNLGFAQVRTYIQSGNVMFESELSQNEITTTMESELQTKLQKPVQVILRTAAELKAVSEGNPFKDANPSQLGVFFFKIPITDDLLKGAEYSGPEEIAISGKEIYIHYPNGIGRSKLRLPKSTQQGTMRNLNTIRKLVELSFNKH